MGEDHHHHDHGHDHDLGAQKSLYAFILFVETFVFVMVPFVFRKAANKAWVPHALALSNCLAGGIFTVAGYRAGWRTRTNQAGFVGQLSSRRPS